MKAKFLGLSVNVLNTTLNHYTFNYTLELPRLMQNACGKDLTLTATGNNDTLTTKTKIFVRNCKSDPYICLFFLKLFLVLLFCFSNLLFGNI